MYDEFSVSPAETATPDVATDIPANGVDNSTPDATEAAPVTQESVEKVEETQETKPEDDPRVPQQLRDHLKGLEKDLKAYKPAYTGLEKAAQELYGTTTPEDIQSTIATVQALAPQLKVLTDPSSPTANVVSTLQSMLPAEHIEGLAWAALNDPGNRSVFLSDPEVLKAISDELLEGRSIEEIQSILANAPETEIDPEREAWRREQQAFRTERQREISERNQRAANERSAQLANRFFEEPTKRILAEDFKLVAPEGANEADKQLFADTAEDIGYIAQARFAKENMAAYMQIDNLYKQGNMAAAQAAEIRLQNRYHATLIKTAERHVNLLKSRSVATLNGQQDKINGVRPDVTGSVEQGEKKEERWDIDAPDFAQKFAASFHN